MKIPYQQTAIDRCQGLGTELVVPRNKHQHKLALEGGNSKAMFKYCSQKGRNILTFSLIQNNEKIWNPQNPKDSDSLNYVLNSTYRIATKNDTKGKDEFGRAYTSYFYYPEGLDGKHALSSTSSGRL